MIYEVRVGVDLAAEIAAAHGPDRSGWGAPSEWDFWSGPLAAALIAFRAFEELRFDDTPAVRNLHLVDPVFGPLVFVGVLVEPTMVEIAAWVPNRAGPGQKVDVTVRETVAFSHGPHARLPGLRRRQPPL